MMRIILERQGGFTGMPLTVQVDTATLSPQQGDRLRQLVAAAKVFALPSEIRAPAHRDCFEYALTIARGDRHHTVIFDETATPESLKPLIHWLIETSQRR